MSPSDRFADLLAAVRLAEQSLTILADDMDDLRDLHRRDHEALVRVQEQLGQVREQQRHDKRTAVQTRGQHLQATATILAGLVGAAAGIGSLLWQILHR